MTTIRRPITIVELDMPKCSHTYGVAPCTASLAASLSCFNTRATCQDTPNFSGTVTQTYRLSDTGIGVPPSVEAIPCVQSVSIAPCKLTPMKGLGQRASVSVALDDFAHHDRGFDPYVASRTYLPEDQGTFWGKFRARHQYYQGRKLRIRTGTIPESGAWDWSAFTDRTYFIDRITGPDKSGKVTITAKDLLKLMDGDRAQCPVASTSTLSADISAGATSLTLLPAGIGAAEYAVREQSAGSGYVRIGSEIMGYTRSGDVLTLTRGAWGSTADAHTAGDSVQLCASWSSVNVATLIKQLLGPLYADIDLANIGTSYLSDTCWADEAVGNSAVYSITSIVSKPEGVDKIIDELCAQCMLLIWWDEVNELVKIKGIAPQLTTTDLTDDANLIDTHPSDDPTQRVSQIWTYYGRIDAAGDEKPQNYRYLYVQADLTAEGADEYGEQKIRSAMSRWLTTTGPVIKTASRALIFARDNPRSVKFTLDSKDRVLDVAANVLMTSQAFQDATGAPLPIGMLITERSEKGSVVEYSAVNMAFYGRYLRIGPGGDNSSGTHVPSTYSGTIADYSTATAAEKKAYGYIIAGGDNSSGTHMPAASTTTFADGGAAYKFA